MSTTSNPAVVRRIVREVGQLRVNPPEGIRVVTDEDNMLDVTGIIAGPDSTPYAGGYFKVKFAFFDEFPAAPPKCRFATKIFHPNVSKQGEICVNTLKKDWKPEYGIGHILTVVKCLLIFPNPESALDEEAGKLLLENYDDYCRHAKLITSLHATPRARPVEFDTHTVPSTLVKVMSSLSSTPAVFLKPETTPVTSAAPVVIHNQVSVITTTKPTSKTSTIHLPPLQNSNTASNTLTPLSATASNTGAKSLKRPAIGGVEKRKKALKRL